MAELITDLQDADIRTEWARPRAETVPADDDATDQAEGDDDATDTGTDDDASDADDDASDA